MVNKESYVKGFVVKLASYVSARMTEDPTVQKQNVAVKPFDKLIGNAGNKPGGSGLTNGVPTNV